MFLGNSGSYKYNSVFASFSTEAGADGSIESILRDGMKLKFYMFSGNTCTLDTNIVRYPNIALSYKDSIASKLSEAEIGELVRAIIPHDVIRYKRVDANGCGCSLDETTNVNILIDKIASLCILNDIFERSSMENGLTRFSFSRTGIMTFTYDIDHAIHHIYIEHCLWMGTSPNIKVAIIGNSKEKTYQDMNIIEIENLLGKVNDHLKEKTLKGKEG